MRSTLPDGLNSTSTRPKRPKLALTPAAEALPLVLYWVIAVPRRTESSMRRPAPETDTW